MVKKMMNKGIGMHRAEAWEQESDGRAEAWEQAGQQNQEQKDGVIFLYELKDQREEGREQQVGQWTRDTGQGAMDKEQRTMDNGRGAMDQGQRTMDNGRGTEDEGRWTRDNGQQQGGGTVGATWPQRRCRRYCGYLHVRKRTQ